MIIIPECFNVTLEANFCPWHMENTLLAWIFIMNSKRGTWHAVFLLTATSISFPCGKVIQIFQRLMLISIILNTIVFIWKFIHSPQSLPKERNISVMGLSLESNHYNWCSMNVAVWLFKGPTVGNTIPLAIHYKSTLEAGWRWRTEAMAAGRLCGHSAKLWFKEKTSSVVLEALHLGHK